MESRLTRHLVVNAYNYALFELLPWPMKQKLGQSARWVHMTVPEPNTPEVPSPTTRWMLGGCTIMSYPRSYTQGRKHHLSSSESRVIPIPISSKSSVKKPSGPSGPRTLNPF